MPVHQFECFDCNHKWEQFVPEVKEFYTCPACNGKARITFDWGRVGGVGINTFKPYLDTCGFPQDVYIESRSQLKDLCHKHGVISHQLSDGYKDYGKPVRWV